MKNKIKSFYYYILDCLTWLLVDDNKKKQWYESEEEQTEEEYRAFVPEQEIEKSEPQKPKKRVKAKSKI